MKEFRSRLMLTATRLTHCAHGTCPHGHGCPPRLLDIVRGLWGGGGGC
jgi:hypothetical protein